jgi:hypothetical protein
MLLLLLLEDVVHVDYYRCGLVVINLTLTWHKWIRDESVKSREPSK